MASPSSSYCIHDRPQLPLFDVVEHVRWEGLLCVSPASLAILCRRVGICQAESSGCWSFLAVSKLLFE